MSIQSRPNKSNNYLIIIPLPFLQISHDPIMNMPRIFPPNTLIRRDIKHVLSLRPTHPRTHDPVEPTRTSRNSPSRR